MFIPDGRNITMWIYCFIFTLRESWQQRLKVVSRNICKDLFFELRTFLFWYHWYSNCNGFCWCLSFKGGVHLCVCYLAPAYWMKLRFISGITFTHIMTFFLSYTAEMTYYVVNFFTMIWDCLKLWTNEKSLKQS